MNSPQISLVIPCYNAAATLGRAIDSCLSQGYPNLQLFVVDGGSRDGTVDVLARLRAARWQAGSRNRTGAKARRSTRALARCTGEIVNWLCADDELLPGSLPDDCRLLHRPCRMRCPRRGQRSHRRDRREGDRPLPARWSGAEFAPEVLADMPLTNCIPQPSCFFRKVLCRRTPSVREDLQYAMDLELWIHFREQGARFHVVDRRAEPDLQ